jgi:hypothetical protein
MGMIGRRGRESTKDRFRFTTDDGERLLGEDLVYST